jgi:nicotinamide mononucleotide (NMN) deamidase PncC
VGTVHIAASTGQAVARESFAFTGNRPSIRHQTVVMSLKQLKGMLESEGE